MTGMTGLETSDAINTTAVCFLRLKVKYKDLIRDLFLLKENEQNKKQNVTNT
jgi:hypothetical protein